MKAVVFHFPLGEARNKNLRIHLGNCNHRKYIPRLLDLIKSGVIEAYQAFDRQEEGWLKVELEPAGN